MLLVDIGLAVTLVHQRLLEGSHGAGGRLQEISGGPVVTANGQPLRIVGVIRNNFNVAGTEFSHNALMTEDVSQECLLGADFLLSHEFVIDLKDKMLHKGSLSTPLIQLSSQVSRVCLDSVVNNVVVRAGEEDCSEPMSRVVVLFLRVQQGLLNPKEELRSAINFCLPEW